MNLHKVPVHLDTEDKFLWGLTFRQVLIMFGGGGAAYLVATTDLSSPFAASLSVLGGVLCSVVTILLAFVKIRHRNLDQWVMVAFLYYSSPQVFYWSAYVEEEDNQKAVLDKKWVVQEKEEDIW